VKIKVMVDVTPTPELVKHHLAEGTRIEREFEAVVLKAMEELKAEAARSWEPELSFTYDVDSWTE